MVVNTPIVSILIGASKDDEHIVKCLDSIVAQTFTNFEVIMVCNGEEGFSLYNRLQGLSYDFRFRYFHVSIRQLAYSLNFGLQQCRAELVARMDADDIMDPNRLFKQFEYLKKNCLDLVGSDLLLIDEKDNAIGSLIFPKGLKINKRIFFQNPFGHNTILAHKSLLIDNRGYLGGFNVEDYDLWIRLYYKKIKWDNMSEKLVHYRRHSGTAQRSLLSYSEVNGLMMKYFSLYPSLKLFFAMGFNFMKFLLLSKRV